MTPSRGVLYLVNPAGRGSRRGSASPVDSEPPALVEVDGDLFGTTPASFEVVPRAVTVMRPA
jgi:diacylglycerol kinase family enzyme